MIYWGLDNDLDLIVVILTGLSIYVAHDITRITKGSPVAWDLIIVSFFILFLYRCAQLYYDTLSPRDLINDWDVSLSVLSGIFLLAGLARLRSGFKRSLSRTQAG